MIGARDLGEGKAFYDATLATLGWPAGMQFRPETVFYSHEGAAFGVTLPINGEAATHANGGTIGFAAPGKEAVDAFHAAGLANGGTCEGEPGKRPQAPGNAYGAYLRDPTGNKICAFCQLPEGA